MPPLNRLVFVPSPSSEASDGPDAFGKAGRTRPDGGIAETTPPHPWFRACS